MTFDQAIAQQPQWVQLWLNVLLLGAFILPLALLFWRASRVAGIVTLLTSVAASGAIYWMYGQLGYVRLLGLPHVVLWTPLVIWLWGRFRHPDMPTIPRAVIGVIMAVMTISLAFDYVDVIRYLLGERTPTHVPAGLS